MHAGEVWAIPVKDLGWTPAVIARAPEPDDPVGFGLIYVLLSVTESLPTPGSVPPARRWDSGWIGLTTARPFNTQRWTKCGTLDQFDPTDWPVPPWSRIDERTPELNSIETTRDAPTMTLIANDAATVEEALEFPPIQVLTAPSQFEKALGKHFKDRKPNPMHDMEISAVELSPQRIDRWFDFALRRRADPSNREPKGIPAGRRTDHHLQPGSWLALPLAGGGFGVCMLAIKPPKEVRFFSDAIVVAINRSWDRWPTLDDVASLTMDDAAMVTQTSMICVRDGRWRVIGVQDDFVLADWQAPYPWGQTRIQVETGVVGIMRGEPRSVIEIPHDPDVFADPEAGRLLRSMTNYRGIESLLGKLAVGVGIPERWRVAPSQFASWRRTNEYISHHLGCTAEELWYPAHEP